jgi:hypothetical protein
MLSLDLEKPMTRLILVTTGTEPISLAAYLNTIAYARKFAPEDVWLSDASYPNLDEATVNLLDNGETAWDVPEFEQCLYVVFRRWAGEGLFIRVQHYARWLLTTIEREDTRLWLSDFERGEFSAHLLGWERCCSIVGQPEDYLYPFQFDLLVAAQCRRDERRAELNRTGAGLAYAKFGSVDVDFL